MHNAILLSKLAQASISQCGLTGCNTDGESGCRNTHNA